MPSNILTGFAATAALSVVMWSVGKPALASPIVVASNPYELQASVALRVSGRYVIVPGSLESTLFVKPSPRHKDVGRRFRYPYRVGDPELCEPTPWTFATRGRAAHRPCWPHAWTCYPPERNWCFIQRP
jgi:hypothetical protein